MQKLGRVKAAFSPLLSYKMVFVFFRTNSIILSGGFKVACPEVNSKEWEAIFLRKLQKLNSVRSNGQRFLNATGKLIRLK